MDTQLSCFQRLASQHASERFVNWGYHRVLFNNGQVPKIFKFPRVKSPSSMGKHTHFPWWNQCPREAPLGVKQKPPRISSDEAGDSPGSAAAARLRLLRNEWLQAAEGRGGRGRGWGWGSLGKPTGWCPPVIFVGL